MNFPTNKREIVPYALSGWRPIVLLAGVLIIGGLIWWAYSGDGKDKEIPYITNIAVDGGKNAVVTNLVVNQQGVVNDAANNSNQADNALNASQHKSSNNFSNNRASVNSRYCQDFPDECR